MGDETLLKSIGEKIDGFTEAIKGINKGDDVSELQKSLDKAVTEFDSLKKELSDKDDMIKGLETEKTDLESKVSDLADTNKELQKTVDEVNTAAAEKAHNDLVKTALDLMKELDPETEVDDEDKLLKSIADNYDEKAIKEDVDGCISSEIKAMNIAKKYTPEGDKPGQGDNNLDDQIDENEMRAKELRKTLKEEGFLAKTEGDE
jgi:chromosome segregation ATPase